MDNFYCIENIFTNEERKDFIKKSKPFLLDPEQLSDIASRMNLHGRTYPGKQTSPDLHERNEFKYEHNRIVSVIRRILGKDVLILKSWGNWTNGKKKDIQWHNHKDSGDLSLVYYMKTVPFFSNGTVFKERMVRSPQNSMLIFPCHMEHTAPSCPFRFDRYTLAMDLVYG